MAIENYYGLNDYGFNLYKKMQDARIKKGYSTDAVQQFSALIESYERNGYDNSSEIEIDKDLKLIDGSHRLALALFYHEQNISCKIKPYRGNVDYGICWFVENDFTIKEIELITSKYDKLLRKIYKPILCVLWPPVARYFVEITEKLDLLYEIKNIHDYTLSDETFKNMVEGIYSIDNIESWKVQKKISGMLQYEKVIRVMDINIKNPRFRLKSSNGKTLSEEGEKIKKIIRNCYKGKLDDYFEDIIIHTGDNYEQSQFIANLLKQYFSLREYFDTITGYSYVILKRESEYITKDFPDGYPFGKDIDILCKEEDFERIVEDTLAFGMRKSIQACNISHISSSEGDRIRIELEDILIFQFDIRTKLGDVDVDFIKDAIFNRIKIENYFVPRMQDELIFRVYEYMLHPQKVRHLNYIRQNKLEWNMQYAISVMPKYEKRIVEINNLIISEN